MFLKSVFVTGTEREFTALFQQDRCVLDVCLVGRFKLSCESHDGGGLTGPNPPDSSEDGWRRGNNLLISVLAVPLRAFGGSAGSTTERRSSSSQWRSERLLPQARTQLLELADHTLHRGNFILQVGVDLTRGHVGVHLLRRQREKDQTLREGFEKQTVQTGG